jgi:hypothetical protein
MSPVRERLRFLFIFLGFAAGIVLFASEQDSSPGRAALLGLGTWLTTYGVVDLIWLASGDVERIWTKTRGQSLLVALFLTAAGLGSALLGIGS